MDLPEDLVDFLKTEADLLYDYKSIEPGFVGIIDFNKLKVYSFIYN